MSLLVQLEFKVRGDNETEMLRVARALAEIAATEPDTLRYKWYATRKPGHFAILEEYANADAAEAHNKNPRIAPLLQQFFAVAELVSASFYGELNQYLRDWISGRDDIALHLPL